MYHCPCTTTVRAATNCELFVLTKPDLDLVMASYPDILHKISQMAIERLEIINQLNLRPVKQTESELMNLPDILTLDLFILWFKQIPYKT